MTHADIYTRLSGTTGSSAAGQSIAAATAAAPVYSTNWIDLDAAGSLRTKRELRDIFAEFWFTDSVDSGTNTATLDLEIVMVPTTTPATPTLAAFNNTSDVAGAIITSAAHGLIDGTRITVAQTTGTLNTGSGYAVATNLYIVNATTNTFGVSATPGGSAITLTDQTGTTVVTWYPEVIGCAAKQPLERLTENAARVPVRINPIPVGQKGYPVHRYLFARYVPTANLSDGVAFCDLKPSVTMSNQPINAINYTTA